MLITTDKHKFLNELRELETKFGLLGLNACLLFDIREILLKQQQNQDENCHFDKIKELAKEQRC